MRRHARLPLTILGLAGVLVWLATGVVTTGLFTRDLSCGCGALSERAPIAPASNSEIVRFAVIGDYGEAGPGEKAVADLVDSWGPDFVITTGDNNYPSGASDTIDRNVGQYYHSYIYPYKGNYGPGSDVNRFFPSLGNHDFNTPQAGPYLDYFTLPGNERYYPLSWGPMALFALDSDPDEPDGVASSSIQAAWLRTSLAESNACWKLVYFHHAPFSSGPHASSPTMQWPFRAWGADAVLAGHDHDYERIWADGLPYFVNGLGGSTRYDFGAPVAGSEVRYNLRFGAMLVTATPITITYQFIAVDGTLVDNYTRAGRCAPRAQLPVIAKQ